MQPVPIMIIAVALLLIAGGFGLSAEADGLDPLAVVAFGLGVVLLIAGVVTLRRGAK